MDVSSDINTEGILIFLLLFGKMDYEGFVLKMGLFAHFLKFLKIFRYSFP
jgi:hypothetical protein